MKKEKTLEDLKIRLHRIEHFMYNENGILYDKYNQDCSGMRINTGEAIPSLSYAELCDHLKGERDELLKQIQELSIQQ